MVTTCILHTIWTRYASSNHMSVGKTLVSFINHTVRTVHTRKLGLTAFDTKRWLLEDTIHTHSHWHYNTVEDSQRLWNHSYIVGCMADAAIYNHRDLPPPTPTPL